MAKKKKQQTRRTISVKGITYKRLKMYCESQGVSVSGWLERKLAEKLDEENVPVPEAPDICQPRPDRHEEILSQYFTF